MGRRSRRRWAGSWGGDGEAMGRRWGGDGEAMGRQLAISHLTRREHALLEGEAPSEISLIEDESDAPGRARGGVELRGGREAPARPPHDEMWRERQRE